MIPCRFLFAGLLLAASATPFAAAQEGYVIFKDGYTIHGRVITQKSFEVDPETGTSIAISAPGGFTYIDDNVRRVFFSKGQIHEVVPLKPGELTRDQIILTRPPTAVNKPTPIPAWRFEKTPAFDKKWERKVLVATPTRKFEMHQRIVVMTPYRLRVLSNTHAWEVNHLTKEIPLEELQQLLKDYFDDHKDFKDRPTHEKKFFIARFLHQVGHLEPAERELNALLPNAAELKKNVEEYLEIVRKERARKLTDDLELMAQSRQHRLVQERLAIYDRDNLVERVPPKTQILVQDLKNRYAADREKLERVESLIQYLMNLGPQPRGFWVVVFDALKKEINLDTLPRLDTFLTFGEQFKKDREAGRTPTHKLDELLALAVTGFHLGNIAAEPDVALSQKLWNARKFFSDYMKIDTHGLRENFAAQWQKEAGLPIDVVTRLMQHLPPPNAYSKISSEGFAVDLDLPDRPAGTYLVVLPPDYHHQRAHPVMMVAHGRERVEITMLRWAPLALKHGFIIVAPLWQKVSNSPFYQFTEKEHEFFLNCLRDLKRRFQVDTDRIFLYGWDQGAEVAFDIGLSHPDQFAGVLPMCGQPRAFAKKYWANGQHVPFYIVDGDKNGNSPVATREFFKDWVRSNFASYFIEYRGRANEIFAVEFENMIDWVAKRSRKYPNRQLGSYHTGGGQGQEFKSHRTCDNRFYWLGSDEINENNLQTYTGWVNLRPSAMFQAAIVINNEAGAKGDARIWNQINLRVSGLKQVTVWLSPAMIDFSKPVHVKINQKLVGPAPRLMTPSITTMLEEYSQSVDRQRLYYAKIDLKL